MKKIDTGIPIVHRFDDVLTPETCAKIYQVFLQHHGVNQDPDNSKLPWFENNTQSWWQLPDVHVRRLIAEQRYIVTKLVSESFNTTVFPTFTDLVLWRPGKQMAKHKDNGYTPDSNLRHRTHTSVVYLNEGYHGGETFVETQWGIYDSVPRTGSMVCFPSDETAEHGVRLVESGFRFTMGIWFCTDPWMSEDHLYSGQIKL